MNESGLDLCACFHSKQSTFCRKFLNPGPLAKLHLIFFLSIIEKHFLKNRPFLGVVLQSQAFFFLVWNNFLKSLFVSYDHMSLNFGSLCCIRSSLSLMVSNVHHWLPMSRQNRQWEEGDVGFATPQGIWCLNSAPLQCNFYLPPAVYPLPTTMQKIKLIQTIGEVSPKWIW